MPSYQELIAQKNALDKRIEEARSTEAKEALATVKQLIATYYDPESGATWTGRGKPPKWIESKDRSQYEIKTTPSVDFNAPRDEKNPFPVQ